MLISNPVRSLSDDLKRRLAATLFAVTAYHALSFVPLPGVSLAGLSPSHEAAPNLQALSRISIVAVGLTAWLSALTLAELITLIAPASWTKRFTTPAGHADPFAWPLLALTMLFAGLQANGIAAAMSTLPDLVPDAGPVFNLTTVATLIGGTALAIVFARLIETKGVGWGFWILLASVIVASTAPAVPQTALIVSRMIGTGLGASASASAELILFLAILVAATAAVVALILARRNMGFSNGEPLVWPVQLYGLLLGNLIIPLAYLVSNGTDARPDALLFLLPNRPVGALIAALLLAAIVYRNANRENSNTLAGPTLAGLAGITWLTAQTHSAATGLMLSAGRVVVVVAVATFIITIVRDGGPTAENPRP